MIIFTQGDALSLTLVCKDHDITGATVTTIFRGKNDHDVIIPNSQHTIDADQTANKGKVVCALTEANTKAVADGDGLDIITKVVQGSAIVHFHGKGILTVRKSTLVR
jgi:hypothetical protein